MRILFDATAMPRQRAGAGVYIDNLARALAAHAPPHRLLITARHGALADLGGRPGVTVRQVQAPSRWRRLLWEQTVLPLIARRWRADVLHGPHHALPLIGAGCALVSTVHDITFDLMPERYTRARRLYMRAITRLGVARAGRVIVPSAAVRDALLARYQADPGRVAVVPEAAPPWVGRVTDPALLADVRARYALPERFVLSVGTREPGKNRAVLLEALARLAADGLTLPLVIAGQRGWLEADQSLPGVQVQALGYVPDADLSALYSLAAVFVFPSWLEGFGLPPLEAMACAAPVVASNRPAMPEVLGDAALYADPADAAAWAAAIARVLQDGGVRAALVAKGAERAARYSWQRAARETLDVYAAAVRERSRRT